MNKTGVVRKLDELGRIVIAKEIRDALCLAEKDQIEIYLKRNNIILGKKENDTETVGIIRLLDELGRVVIPKEIRDTLDLNVGDEIELLLDIKKIVLKKHYKNCVYCGAERKIHNILGKPICSRCINKIKKEIAQY